MTLLSRENMYLILVIYLGTDGVITGLPKTQEDYIITPRTDRVFECTSIYRGMQMA